MKSGDGMLWSAENEDAENNGKASVNMENYAKLNNAGCNSVKEVFPETKIIVHLQEGNDAFNAATK